MNKFKSLLLSVMMLITTTVGFGVPATVALALIPDVALGAECTMYETLHPNYPLTGSHLSTGKCGTCASCHAGGVYLGTPKVCATCHSGNPSGQISAATIGKSAAHIPIGTTTCDTCHNTTSFTATWQMVHSGVSTQTCTSCHDGTFTAYGAMGKDTNHILTSTDCSSCHAPMDTGITHTNADWFIPVAQIHNGITTGCVSCHDGTHARGKSYYAPGHPATSDACETCHSINNTFKCASLIEDKPFLAILKRKLFA